MRLLSSLPESLGVFDVSVKELQPERLIAANTVVASKITLTTFLNEFVKVKTSLIFNVKYSITVLHKLQ